MLQNMLSIRKLADSPKLKKTNVLVWFFLTLVCSRKLKPERWDTVLIDNFVWYFSFRELLGLLDYMGMIMILINVGFLDEYINKCDLKMYIIE